MAIHSTAIISPDAQIGKNVTIGPYAVIEGKTTIGDNCHIYHHATVGCSTGKVTLGESNIVHSGAVIGTAPQDLSYKGECTELHIGSHNTFREFVTVNIGTTKDKRVTLIGDHCLLMAYVHIAHDCIIGDRVVIANSTQFAGHVHVKNNVVIGGGSLINQFIEIGEYAYIAGDSVINKDILPFSIAQGRYAVMRATNKIGLDRADFSKEDISNIHQALRIILKGSHTKEEAIKVIESECYSSPHIDALVQAYSTSKRGIAL